MMDDGVENRRVKEYMPLVKHVLKKFGKAWSFRRHVWDDLFGVAYLALVGADRDFNPDKKTKFKTHAYGCIRNAVRNEIRSMMCWKRNSCSLDGGWDEDKRKYSFVKSHSDSPYSSVERGEVGDILVRAFRGLSSDDVAIVAGHYVCGKKYAEIKGDLGLLITVSGIEYRKRSAIKKLKEVLWQNYVESDLL